MVCENLKRRLVDGLAKPNPDNGGFHWRVEVWWKNVEKREIWVGGFKRFYFRKPWRVSHMGVFPHPKTGVGCLPLPKSSIKR